LYLHGKEESLAQLETQDLVRDTRLSHGWVWQLLVQLVSLMLAGHQDCLTHQVQQSWAGSHHVIPATQLPASSEAGPWQTTTAKWLHTSEWSMLHA